MDSSSRHQANRNELERPSDTNQNTDRPETDGQVAPEALRADLRFIVDAWDDLVEAIEAGVLAMVRATLERGDGE
jgi:hypothetical protein